MMRTLAAVACTLLLASPAPAQTDAQALGCASGGFEDCRQLLLVVEVKRGAEPDLEATLAPVFNKARAVFAAACEEGDASDSGCFAAGMMHAAKRPVGLAEALPFFARSCDGGYAPGCTQLGNAYTAGTDPEVPWDPERALAAYKRAASLHEKACDLGAMGECRRLAEIYEGGLGVAKDSARAARLYARACKGGVAEACDRGRNPR